MGLTGLTSRRAKSLVLAAGALLAAAAWIASLALGHTPIPAGVVIEALTAYDPGVVDQLIVRTERLSRAVTAAVVGAGLGVAGALMQALTRNALASPSILGINAGATFFVVCAVSLFGLAAPADYVWAAFLGAALAGVLVYLLGMRSGRALSPLHLVLAGVAITALFISFSQAVLIINHERFQSVLFWLAGSVSGRRLETVLPLLPWFALAAVACVALTRHLNLLVLDDEVIAGLGQRTLPVRLLVGAVVIVLAGGAVALAGMIGFVGLIVPHIVRGLVGLDHRWVLPGCALLGAALVLIADTAGRFVIPPQEVPVGVMTALLGTPFFILLARRRNSSL